jgi:hypothetical protein
VNAEGGEEEAMSKWAMDAWLVQLFGVVLAGAAVIVAILFLVERGRRRKDRSDEVGIPGNLPAGPGINISRVAIGGDVAGFALVVWVVAVLVFAAWGWALAVAVGAVLVAIALFLWHRFHPR